MPRESQAAKSERLGEIIAGLQQTYPDAHCELNYRNPLQLMVATILSAQCTDKQVNIVTKNLFKKYKKAADFAAVPLEELQNDIRRIGLFRNKAKNIQNACHALVEQHKGITENHIRCFAPNPSKCHRPPPPSCKPSNCKFHE